MYRLGHTDCAQLLDMTAEFISWPDGAGWRNLFLRRIQSVLPFEFAGFHWVHRGKRQIGAAYEPEKPVSPVNHNDFWRLVQDHPLNPRLFQGYGTPWKITDAVPRSAFRNTELYSALYRPMGVDCEIAATLPDSSGQNGCLLLTLHRHRSDFSERDRAILSLLLPHLQRLESRSPSMLRPRSALPSASPLEVFKQRLSTRTVWSLTPREMEVLFWIQQGKTNAEIGEILGISERTAETHALRSYPKMGVENRYAALVAMHRVIP